MRRILNAATAIVLLVMATSLPPLDVSRANASPEVIDSGVLDTVLDAAHFAEPLIRTKPTSAAEDLALSLAVTAYEQRTRSDDVVSLTDFVAAHPDSGWTPAVEINLGITYLYYGFFSKALSAWESAWEAGSPATDPQARALIDRSVGELARLYTSLGHTEKVASLFEQMGDRAVVGSATEAIQLAREQLDLVTKDPRHLFNCGPVALRALMLALGIDRPKVDFLRWYQAGPKGTNLSELASLAEKAGLPFNLILRDGDDAVPMPSLVHWKVGHFAAITDRRGDLYQIEDPVYFSQPHWISAEALEQESSGYFLVPQSVSTDERWQTVEVAEAASVWGKGPTTGTTPGDNDDPPAKPSDPDCGMCRYNIRESSVSLTLSDTPVGYVPPIGPSAETRITYNQREANQPQNSNFFNVSPKWSINWLTYVTDNPANPGASVTRNLPSGGAYFYTGYNSASRRFKAQSDDGSVLVLATPQTYRRQLADGSVEIYAQSDGATGYPRRIFLSQIVDPQGNALTLSYDSQLRLTALTDATSRQTTFSYDTLGYSRLVSAITDPFGRSATLKYDAYGRLTAITDTIGITSRFAYDANSLVNAMTTPYGTTSFAYTAPGTSAPPRFVQITDPMGFHERLEWLEPASIPNSDPASTVPQGMPLTPVNNYLKYRNSFYWDKDAYVIAGCTPSGGCDYTLARNTHFTHLGDSAIKATVIESIKHPLENRIWYNYPGQVDAKDSGSFNRPIATGRRLDDGTTQLALTSYDTGGYFKIRSQTDPVGRITSYNYANQVDLAAVSQTTEFGVQETLAQLTYNTKHRPVTITDAAGATTRYAYNAAGQPVTVTNPLGEIVSYEYDADHNLSRVVNANGLTAASYTYDAENQIRTYSDSEGWTVTYDYDDLGRVTLVTYPDATTETYVYDRLDLASYTDRQHQTWHYAYDDNQRLVSVTDPLSGQTVLAYDKTGQLVSLIDPNGNETAWAYDVQGRLTAKVFADASTITHAYETTTSRLKRVTDALGQIKQFAYAKDDLPLGITYLAAINATPNVSFAYDPYFRRVASRADGSGTTEYSYLPVGSAGALRLAQDNGPLANDTITYAYDELGRVVSRAIGLAGPETFAYDALGRVTGHTSDLGNFSLAYLGQTDQLTNRSLASTTLETTWSYLDNLGDRRLAAVENTGLSVGQYSNFAFTTSPTGQYTSIEEDSDVAAVFPPVLTQTATYNDLNQLTDLSGQALTYDANGNLLSDGARTYSWDAENRLVAVTFTAEPGKVVAFQYDGLDRRTTIAKTPAGGGSATETSYLWCGNSLCQARNSLNTLVRGFFPEGEVVPGGTAAEIYYGVDQIGSVRRAFSDLTTSAFDYDAYGVALQPTAPETNVLFGGMHFDPDVGLYLTKHRAYDPKMGRWLSRDSLVEEGTPTGNPYLYVDDNPVRFVDPLGLAKLPANPSGLPSGWSPDPSHQDPNGERFRDPADNCLDFHKGRPGLPGWRGRDHWHYNDDGKHLAPGDDVPDPQYPRNPVPDPTPPLPSPDQNSLIWLLLLMGTIAAGFAT